MARDERRIGIVPRDPAPAPLSPPADADRLLTVADVAARFPAGTVTAAWVKRHVAPTARRRLGRSLVWRAADVDAWYARFVKGELREDEKPAKLARDRARQRDRRRGGGANAA